MSQTTAASSLALERIRWVFDPVPEWIRATLDRDALAQLAHIEMEYQHTVLKAQLQAFERISALTQKAAGKRG